MGKSVGSNSRASCMDRCQRRGDDQMDCQRRCESEESMSGRSRDVYRNRDYYGSRKFYGNRNYYGNRNFDRNSMNGQEYCESEFMLRNEESCKASSCCQWDTWEEGEASFNGQGRCWSDIGTKMCTDMFEGEESVGAVASRGSGCGVGRVWNGGRCVPHLLEKSVGSNSRASCMDRCQRRGDDQMDCQRRCESEESTSGRGRDVYRNRDYYGSRNFYGNRNYYGNRNFYGNRKY